MKTTNLLLDNQLANRTGPKTWISLLIAFLPLVSVAQIESVKGTWEADSHSPEDFVQHTVPRLSDERYELVTLSDNPDSPFTVEEGIYTVTQSQISLRPSSGTAPTFLDMAADGGTLTWQTMAFSRGAEFSDNIHGNWQLISPTGQIGGEIRLHSDGIYEYFAGDEYERGPFVIAGSGMVHWPTEANNGLLGVPGLWTELHLEDDRLSFTLPAAGVVIHATRISPTMIETLSWGQVKNNF